MEPDECQISIINPAGVDGYPVLSLDDLDERDRVDLLIEWFMSASRANSVRTMLKVPNRPSPNAYQFRKTKSGGRYANAWHRVHAHLIALAMRALDDVYEERGAILSRKDLVEGLGLYAEGRLRRLIYAQEPGESPPGGYVRWAYVTYATLDIAAERAASVVLEHWYPMPERRQRKMDNLVHGQRSRRSPTRNTATNLQRLVEVRRNDPGLTGAQEAERLGVSLRTLRRLIARLDGAEI